MEIATETQTSTHRHVRFSYTEISRDFVESTIQLLEDGESVVLLGARGIGKQFVASEVANSIDKHEFNVLVRLRCEHHTDATSASLCLALAEPLAERLPNGQWSQCNSFANLAAEIVRSLADSPHRVVFVISNVEFLPDSVARRLLKLLRELTDLGKSIRGSFCVLLTGASELAPLVHGKDSEFAVRYQFVVTGMDAETFRGRLYGLIDATRLDIDSDCSDYIFSETGGSLLLLQLVADAILDSRRAECVSGETPIGASELKNVVEYLKRYSSAFADVVLRSFARIEASAASLQLVQQLVDNGTCAVPSRLDTSFSFKTEDSPTEPELCGIAKRNDNKLCWASPLMAALASRYFTPWVLGDGLACNNEWESAFDCYLRAKEGETAWVCSTSQRPRLRGAMRAFEAKLFSIASLPAVPVDELGSFFAIGATFLLGFDEVTFWHYYDDGQRWDLHHPHCELASPLFRTSSDDAWQRLANQANLTTSNPTAETLVRSLGSPETLSEGMNRPDDQENHSLIVRLPELEGVRPEVIILSCSQTENPLTRDRLTQTELVCTAYSRAFEHFVKNRHHWREAELQRQLLLAMPEVFQVIGGPPERSRQALSAAGEILRQNGYRRVMFSLVDFTVQRIMGVVDCRAEGECDIAAMTDYSLDVTRHPMTGRPQYQDVQQACVLSQSQHLIDSANDHPLTNKDVVKDAHLQAISLFPLRTKNGKRVVGTMHVERNDRKPLEPEQVRVLELFADFIARAVIAAENVDVLEGALHEQCDAYILLDHTNSIRYINRAAQERLSSNNDSATLAPGWQPDNMLLDADDLLPQEAVDLARQAREHERGLSRYVRHDDDQESLYVVSSHSLKDWRKCTVGTLLQIQDHDDQNDLLSALKQLSACGDVEELKACLTTSLQTLGHEWGRLYLVEPQSGELVGEMQYGMESDGDGALAFENHTVVLPSRGTPGTTWLCFKHGKASVYSYIDSAERRVGEIWYTENGLPVLNTRETSCPDVLARRVGDIWVDVPLFVRRPGTEETQSPLGKLTLHCPDGLSPTKLEWLQVLGEAVSTVVATLADRERWARSTELLCRQSMLRAIGETCHQLQSEFTSLATHAGLYDGASAIRIQQLNSEFNERLNDIQRLLKNVKSRLQPVRCKLQREDLTRFVRKVLGDQLEHGACRVVGNDLYADFDPELMKEAIEELIQNARKAVGPDKRLSMRVEVIQSFDRVDRNPYCEIWIRDNGPGIPAGHEKLIFDDWYHEWPEPTEGTGLGLSRVQHIVNAHNGTIRAEPSTPGATLVIAFPRDAEVAIREHNSSVIAG